MPNGPFLLHTVIGVSPHSSEDNQKVWRLSVSLRIYVQQTQQSVHAYALEHVCNKYACAHTRTCVFTEQQCSPQIKLMAYWKAYYWATSGPTPIPHQRKSSTEGIYMGPISLPGENTVQCKTSTSEIDRHDCLQEFK